MFAARTAARSALRQTFARRAYSTHPVTPKKSDLPWIAGSALVFIPLFISLTAPPVREKLHTVTSVHSEEHAAVVPAATVEEEDKEEGHVTAPNPANDKKEEDEEATTPVENGVKTEEKSEKDHGNDHASVGEDAKEGNEQAKAAKKTEMPGNQGKTEESDDSKKEGEKEE